VHTIKGRAMAATPDGDIRLLNKGAEFYSGETISTLPNTYVRLAFTDESFVVLRPNTRFLIEDYNHTGVAEEEKGFFSLLKGGMRSVTGLVGKLRKENYRVNTAMATIGIRGTDYEARVCFGDCVDVFPSPPDGLYVGVQQNQVIVVEDAQGNQIEMGTGDYLSCLAGGGGGCQLATTAKERARIRRIVGAPSASCE
jgi:hypothetical protein